MANEKTAYSGSLAALHCSLPHRVFISLRCCNSFLFIVVVVVVVSFLLLEPFFVDFFNILRFHLFLCPWFCCLFDKRNIVTIYSNHASTRDFYWPAPATSSHLCVFHTQSGHFQDDFTGIFHLECTSPHTLFKPRTSTRQCTQCMQQQ